MNRFLMKLFITSNIEIVTYCREQFNFDLPSVILARHTSLFLDKLRRCDSYLNKDITVCPKKSEPLNILQQQPQICSDFNNILHTQDVFCYKHYYIVSYKSALTVLKYDFLNNITHKA